MNNNVAFGWATIGSSSRVRENLTVAVKYTTFSQMIVKENVFLVVKIIASNPLVVVAMELDMFNWNPNY